MSPAKAFLMRSGVRDHGSHSGRPSAQWLHENPDYTCVCGLYVHRGHISWSPENHHIIDCPFTRWEPFIPPAVSTCDLCICVAAFSHPQGGLRCRYCPRPEG